MTPPVLLIMFNRPDLARRVLESIRAARPTRLYLAVDGPRVGNENDVEGTTACRGLESLVDWECQVQVLYQTDNLGCRRGVESAISWFFEHEEFGIILEDDCLPAVGFFNFCGELLERYSSDTRVMSIGGFGEVDEELFKSVSYEFTVYNLIWGWATWRRAWRLNCLTSDRLNEGLESPWLESFLGEPNAVKYWRRQMGGAIRGEVDTWDYQWRLSIWMNNGLSITPSRNLVKNIGFDERATHTVDELNNYGSHEVAEIDFPLQHPATVCRAYAVDRYLERNRFHVWKMGVRDFWWNKLSRKCKSLILRIMIQLGLRSS
jgi:hypothetical protein